MDRLDHIEGRIEEIIKLVHKKNHNELVIHVKAGASHTSSNASSPILCTKEVRWNVGFRITKYTRDPQNATGCINKSQTGALSTWKTKPPLICPIKQKMATNNRMGVIVMQSSRRLDPTPAVADRVDTRGLSLDHWLSNELLKTN